MNKINKSDYLGNNSEPQKNNPNEKMVCDAAEQGVLGCMILEPELNVANCIEKLKSNENIFYNSKHKIIYKTILELYNANELIDCVTLVDKLNRSNLLEAAGGVAYVTSLPDATPSAANLDYYIKIIKEKFLLRKIYNALNNCVAEVTNPKGDVNELVDSIESKILQLNEENIKEVVTPSKEMVRETMAKIEYLHQNKGSLIGISSGYSDLDKLTFGFKGGEMIVIAGRPGMGKTSLAMNIAEHVAIDQKIPTGIFSLEMSKESIGLRLISSRSRIDFSNLQASMGPRFFKRGNSKILQLNEENIKASMGPRFFKRGN